MHKLKPYRSAMHLSLYFKIIIFWQYLEQALFSKGNSFKNIDFLILKIERRKGYWVSMYFSQPKEGTKSYRVRRTSNIF